MRLKPLLQRLSIAIASWPSLTPRTELLFRLAERIGMVNERKVLWEGKAAYLFSPKA